MSTHINPNNYNNSNTQVIEVRPKLKGFLFSYILFSLPGFLIGLAWLGISILIFVSIFAGIVFGTSNTEADFQSNMLTLETVQKGDQNGILIYDLSGVIQTGSKTLPGSSRNTGIYTEVIEKDFQKIKQDSKIKNIVFRLNTPGGSVFASQVLADQIKSLLDSKGQTEAVFYYDQIAASGGLWATFQNKNYVVGSKYGETGSIGVILEVANLKKLADNIGYSQTTIKSSPSKDIGNPLRDLSTEEAKFLQKQVDTEYAKFIKIVAEGRNIPESKVKEFANGYVYTNQEALSLGLLDEIGSVDRAITRAAKNSNLSSGYSVWQIKSELGFVDTLLGQSSIGSLINTTSKTAQQINSVTALDSGVIYAIEPSRM
jgi:protease IV